jgi:chromosome segregation ATPase
MNGEPPKESYTPFIAELTNTDMLKRIRQAWEKVIYKRNESGPKSCSSDELYKEWIKNRVAEIQLPFAISRNQGEASTIQEDSNEVKELKLKLKNLEDEKSALEDKFIKLNTSFKDLEYEVRDKTRSLEEANERARIEEACKNRTKDALFAANAGLRRLNADNRRLMLQNKRLRDAQREMRKGLNTLKTQVRDQVVANDELKMEFKKQLEKKQEELEEIKRGTVSGV